MYARAQQSYSALTGFRHRSRSQTLGSPDRQPKLKIYTTRYSTVDLSIAAPLCSVHNLAGHTVPVPNLLYSFPRVQ
jgi:hypothetical protein